MKKVFSTIVLLTLFTSSTFASYINLEQSNKAEVLMLDCYDKAFDLAYDVFIATDNLTLADQVYQEASAKCLGNQ
jgi:hypothetical protein